METIHIIDSQEFVSKNFTYHEYFKPKFGKSQEFDCPKMLIDAVQFLREYFDMPFKITCTIGTVNWGYHPKGLAVDSVPEDDKQAKIVLQTFEKFCLEYRRTRLNKLIQGLRDIGITGFGIEPYCIHLDCRPESTCKVKDSYGQFTLFRWVNDGTKFGKSEVIY